MPTPPWPPTSRNSPRRASKASAIGQEARDKAKAEAEAERRKTEDELNASLEKAEARIASIKAAALKEVDAIAEETAGLIVSRLIGAKVDKQQVAAAVKAARELGARHGPYSLGHILGRRFRSSC